jgi:4-amino-4-deoxy-L-arabinose transferase-like glycosyltransferase
LNPTHSETGNRRATGWLSLAVAVVWMLGFSVWFSQFDLPNNHVSRSALWQASPYDVMDLFDPPARADEPPWSWAFLLQRVPFLLIASIIWAGAWGQGSLILRCLPIRLQNGERLFFAGCMGLSSVSLTMLGLGLGGWMSPWALLVLLLGPCLCETLLLSGNLLKPVNSNSSLTTVRKGFLPQWSWLGWCVVIVLVPFVFSTMLGAMSPQTDFDVVEYHLGGPKEWFQQGQIIRLPHNVYTNFPFLTEMLVLCGMVLYGDWQWGALAGQAAIAGFAPVTALGLSAFCRRWFSEKCGWLAALVYLTSPWTYRISIIAYAESGLACYLFAALFAVLLFRERILRPAADGPDQPIAYACLTGLMAGSGMACKYTGAYSVVAPTGLLLLWFAARAKWLPKLRNIAFSACVFAAGVMATAGPWLMKNALETGNPVYPLAVRVFGGIDRDPEINAKWVRGHAAKSYPDWQERLIDLPVKLIDVVSKNDWHSPLMFALAPLSLFWIVPGVRKRKVDSLPDEQSANVGIVWLYVGWQFLTWWVLTHHIDRFYVPMFPAVAVLAGVGACWWLSRPESSASFVQRTVWAGVSGTVIVVSLFYNAELMIRSGISGFNAGRIDLRVASEIAVAPRLKWLNDAYDSGRLPPSTKVLCVGDALMFHAKYPYLYNTVFDHSILERICTDPSNNDHRMRPAEQIHEELKKRDVGLIDVNWAEILRYREPGNYGFTDFVHPDRFEQLQQMAVLGPAMKLPAELTFAPLDDDLRRRLEQWAPSLITTYEGKPAFIKAQIFPVLDRNP